MDKVTSSSPLHVGVVACSLPGAAMCVQTLCAESERLIGPHHHPEISLNMLNFADHVRCVSQRRWDLLGDMLLKSSERLRTGGAEFLICPDNTAHCAYDVISARVPLPWLHIAEPVALEAKRLGYRRVGLLGTRATAQGPVYPAFIERHGIELHRPGVDELGPLEEVIFSELSRNVVSPRAQSIFIDLCERLARAGCDAVILGCTELPLLCTEGASGPLPHLDSTRLLARAAAHRAVARDHSPLPGQ
jgi:aspartate racemase